MSALSDKLKEKGLDIAEDQVKLIVENLFEIAEVAIKEDGVIFDDVALPLLPILKDFLMKYVDKIDNVAG